jgi:succinate dehydrogenase/fumarate reductase flavoprotein subunit
MPYSVIMPLNGVAGLFAAGESACVSVHGANRLGGNSLLEARVFGRRAGLHAAFEAKSSARLDDAGDVVTDIPAIRDHVDAAGRRGDMMTTALRRELGQVMDRFAGAERDAAGLAEAAQRLDHLGGERDGNPSGAAQGDTVARLELDNLLSLARLVVASATVRRESRGAHFRRDHPRRNDATWLYHTILTRVDGDHQQSVERIPVRVDEWSPQVRSY